MAFVWRTGSTSDGNIVPLSPAHALGPRVTITTLLILGVFYFLAITNTFRRYGAVMDEAWKDRVIQWAQDKSSKSSNFLTAGPRMDAFPLSSLPIQIPQYSKWTGSVHLPSQQDILPEINTNGPRPPVEDVESADSTTDSFDIYVEPPSRPASLTGSIDSLPDAINYLDPALSPTFTVEPATPDVSYTVPYADPDYVPGIPDDQFRFMNEPISVPAPMPFRSTKVIDLRYLSIVGGRMPEYIFRRGISNETWNQFINVRCHCVRFCVSQVKLTLRRIERISLLEYTMPAF